MPVCRLLIVSATLVALAPALAAEPPKRAAERSLDSDAKPMPAAGPTETLAPVQARKDKRIRYSFPAPKRVM